MKQVNVYNITSRKYILQYVKIANTFFSRLRGLLPKNIKSKDHILVLMPCKCIHTFGMSYAIDVIFVSKEGRILKIINDMKPNRWSPIIKNSQYVIEIESGIFSNLGIEEGDQIMLEII